MLGRHRRKLESILSDLEDEKWNYQLGGVELTIEDAQRVEELTDELFYEDAVAQVLKDIRDVLDTGLERQYI